MKFFHIGLGSMGKRRIRNLTFLQAGELIAFDPRSDRRREAEEKYGIKTVESLEEGLRLDPDALIISTPPDKHMPYMIAAAEAQKPFFCEASVVDDGIANLIRLCAANKVLGAPSATLRFNPSIKRIRSLVQEGVIGRPLGLTYHSGQYLPDWHPWEDYRTYYVSKRESGACREIVPFELSWITWIFGGVGKISAFRDKVSKLDCDIDDIYQVLLRFNDGMMGHLMVDVLARHAFRVFRLLGEEGVISWDWQEQKVRVFQASDGKWTEYAEPEPPAEAGYLASEGMYIDEMRHFIASVEGRETYHYTLDDDRRVLAILAAAEQSSDSGRHVTFESDKS